MLNNGKVVIVNYGIGNLGSIYNMLKYIGVSSTISYEKSDIEKSDKLILSGVGAFDNAVNQLNKLDLISLLKKKVEIDKVPILGICLGMQLFSVKSEEGILPGLGWVDGNTIKFTNTGKSGTYKIPHMGWNSVSIKKSSCLFNGLDHDSKFYFVHSYHLLCNDEANVLSTTDYGYEFVSSVEKDNIFGVQFHPEKSHKFGMKMLKNFIELI